MPVKRTVRQTDFSGGVNLIASGVDMPENQVRQAADCYIDASGSLYRRPGYIRCDTFSGVSCYGLTSWIPILTSEDMQVVKLSLGGGLITATATTPGSPSPPFTYNGVAGSYTCPSSLFRVVFAQLTDTTGTNSLYCSGCVGGQIGKFQWNGVAYVLSGITPPANTSATFVLTHNQRLISFGDNDYLAYSGLNDGDSIGDPNAGGGAVRINASSGRIVDGLSVGSSLFLLHRNGLSRFTGWSTDDIAIQQQNIATTAGVGFSKAYAAISLGNIGYVLADNGYVYSLTEDGSMALVNKDFPIPNTNPNSFWAGVMFDRMHQHLVWVGRGGALYCLSLLTGGWTTGQLLGEAQSDGLFTAGNGAAYINQPFNWLGGIRSYAYNPQFYSYYADANLDDVAANTTGGTAISSSIQPRTLGDDGSYKAVKQLRVLHTLDSNVSTPPSLSLQSSGSGAAGACIFLRNYNLYKKVVYVPPTEFTAGMGSATGVIDLLYSDSTNTTGGLSGIEVDYYDYGNRY